VDYQAALARLDQLVCDIDAYDVEVSGQFFGTSNPEALAEIDTRVLEGVSIAQAIASTIRFRTPLGPSYLLPGTEDRWRQTKQSARDLRAKIATSAEAARIVGPTGPSMTADGLHSAIWNAALYLWNDKHYRAAVQAAATQLELMTKSKLGVSMGGKDLFAQAFKTDDPSLEQPRLRLSIPRSDAQRWTSQHEGAQRLGMGAMQLIRNDSSHDLTELPANIAFEYLAVLSVVARQVETAEVVRYRID
jgi:uncharacterized protein (TIGR02391 family)